MMSKNVLQKNRLEKVIGFLHAALLESIDETEALAGCLDTSSKEELKEIMIRMRLLHVKEIRLLTLIKLLDKGQISLDDVILERLTHDM